MEFDFIDKKKLLIKNLGLGNLPFLKGHNCLSKKYVLATLPFLKRRDCLSKKIRLGNLPFLKGQGQTTIEFLLIILIILIFLQAVTQPAIQKTSNAIEDTKRVGMLKIAGEKLANSIKEIAFLSGDSKKTIELILPPESILEVKNDGTINASVFLKTMLIEGKAEGAQCSSNEECASEKCENNKCSALPGELPETHCAQATQQGKEGKIACYFTIALPNGIAVNNAFYNFENSEKNSKQTIVIEKINGVINVS